MAKKPTTTTQPYIPGQVERRSVEDKAVKAHMADWKEKMGTVGSGRNIVIHRIGGPSHDGGRGNQENSPEHILVGTRDPSTKSRRGRALLATLCDAKAGA